MTDMPTQKPQGASELLPKLRKIQEELGKVPGGAIAGLARELKLDEEQVYAVASYYPVFSPGQAASGRVPRALALSLAQSAGEIAILPAKGRILERCGRKLKDYEGYKKALSITPEEIIDLVKRSGLRGRGGAGFPAAVKWETARNALADQRYVVCNAAEGDIGAFMDRALLEGDVHSVIEGMAILARAIGASRGYIYLRAEYGGLIPAVEAALGEARALGVLTPEFDVEVFFAAGMYVCGEETALINSMEGRTGRPRNKPPFPAESGLWGKPTVVSNVKTLAQVALILREGVEPFLATGTGRSRGSAILSLTGHAANVGVAEVPMGTSLADVVLKIGGGVAGGKKLKAVQTGGPLGGFIPAKDLGIPVTFEDFAAAGSPLGSGGLIVMDETTCMVAATRSFMDFNREESCGWCAPCRLGTEEIQAILRDICEGRGRAAHLGRLRALAEAMAAASFCAFGQAAPNILLSALRHYPGEFEEHVLAKKCSCGFCRLGGGK